MIGRRHVFHIGGYDPIVPETQLARLRRSLSSFQKTWNVSAQAQDPIDASEVSAAWSARVRSELVDADALRDAALGRSDPCRPFTKSRLTPCGFDDDAD